MAGLPGPMSFEDFAAFRAASAGWLPAAADIARSHGLPSSGLQVFANGSNLVAALDSRLILKIFPPMLRHQFVSERTSLRVLAGKLRIPIPAVQAEGERDGWPYLVISRLPGLTGESVWPSLPEDQKVSVLAQVGEVIAEVQAVPAGELLRLEPRWDEFVPRQIAGCEARLARLGLPDRLVRGLGAYLAGAASLLPAASPPVILTGEYIPENFVLEESSSGWRVSGLIDFGDVMTGWGEYDLLGPGTFMCGGVRARVRALLGGFGYADERQGPELARRLMTLYLLHRYCDPQAQIRIEGWQSKAASIEELERLIWPL